MVMIVSLVNISGLAFLASETDEIDESVKLIEAKSFNDVDGALRIEDMYPSLKQTRSLNTEEIMDAIDEEDQVNVDGIEYDVEYELVDNEIAVFYTSEFLQEEEGSKQARGTSKYYASVSTGITVYNDFGKILGTGNRTFSIPVTKTTSGSRVTYKISSSYASTIGYYGLTPSTHRALVTNRTAAGTRSYVRVEAKWKRGLRTYTGRNVWNAPLNK